MIGKNARTNPVENSGKPRKTPQYRQFYPSLSFVGESLMKHINSRQESRKAMDR